MGKGNASDSKTGQGLPFNLKKVRQDRTIYASRKFQMWKTRMSFLDFVEKQKFVILLLPWLQTNICLCHPLLKCIFLFLLLLRKIWATVGERFLLFFFFKQHLFPFFSSRQNFGKRRFLFLPQGKMEPSFAKKKSSFFQLQYFSRTCLSVYIPEFFLSLHSHNWGGGTTKAAVLRKTRKKYPPQKEGKLEFSLIFREKKARQFIARQRGI